MFTIENQQIYSVSQLTTYIRETLESNPVLYNFWVRGEVSDFKKAYSGHCYFKLKDQDAILNCVMFKGWASHMNFEVSSGMKVMARGGITLYEKGGSYQLLVKEMKPDGLGELFLQFLQLKEKLHQKGYFAEERKRPIPMIPKGIGIATSLKGAGLQDMISTIKKRLPSANIYISPTVVQGSEAPESIAKSIDILNRYEKVEVIIIGRGGGSFEDLNCFNSEIVADAVFKSEKPIISGVGHETDFTISDMTADLRAETPTAAAASSVPNISDLFAHLNHLKIRMYAGLTRTTENRRAKLDLMNPEKVLRNIFNTITNRQQTLDYIGEKMRNSILKKIETSRVNLKHLGEKLEALSPYNVLDRGYAIIREQESGKIKGRASEIRVNDEIEILFTDGTAPAVITMSPKLDGELKKE
jgi:exodeoxyribonuclease VII large subunit